MVYFNLFYFKMKKKSIIILFFIAFCFGNFSCEKPPSTTKDQVMQKRLDERMKRWREGVARNCHKDVMEAASTIVDSTFLANARFKRDTSDIPAIPGRPDRPEFVPPEDTMAVKPILDVLNSIDTLERKEKEGQ